MQRFAELQRAVLAIVVIVSVVSTVNQVAEFISAF